jgi:hypothetical protein
LGFANNLRDHVKNFSSLAMPLQELVNGYTKSMEHQKCGWRATFHHLKDFIDKSQMLFYFDIQPGDEVQLKTDASDYGIGAYLYIVQNGRKIPIRYLSRSLAAQLNWSTPENECFAIWYALKQMEHLRQDVHFVIHTDHENLTRAYSRGSAKVFRWKMFM